MQELSRRQQRAAIIKFTVPVIVENMVVNGLGLTFSSIVGGISASSLAAANTGNMAMNMIIALFSTITTGSAILCARLTGQNDERGASEIVEQTLLLALVSSTAFTALMLAASAPVVRLLMPGADAAFYAEGLAYFRMALFSVPALIVINAMIGIFRAAGESRLSMLMSAVMIVVQLASGWLFVKVLKMEVRGAGLAYVVCRYVGLMVLTVMLIGHHRGFRVRKIWQLRFHGATCLRVMRVGLPCSVDALAVQSGYLVINTLMIGLGAFEASVNSVLSALCTILGVSHGVASAAATTLVGQRLGAGRRDDARRRYLWILGLSCLFSTLLLLPILAFPATFAGIFSAGEVKKASAAMIWVLIPYSFPAVGVNATEPAARVGGEGRMVMISCCVCVWLIRLPLTYLFCYPLQMGVVGLFLANAISLAARAVWSFIRIQGSKWGLSEL